MSDPGMLGEDTRGVELGFRALLLGNSLLWAGHGNMLVLFKSSCRAGPRLFRLLWIFPSCPPFLKGNKGVYCGHRPCLQGLNFSSRENSSCLVAEACCCVRPVASVGKGFIVEAGAALPICPPAVTNQRSR